MDPMRSWVAGFVDIQVGLPKQFRLVFGFFLLALGVSALAAITRVNQIGAMVILTALIAAAVLTTVLVWRSGPRPRGATTAVTAPPYGFRRRLIYLAPIVFALALATTLLHRIGIIAKAIPVLYPAQTAEATVDRYFDRLDKLLAERGETSQPVNFLRLLELTTSEYRKRYVRDPRISPILLKYREAGESLLTRDELEVVQDVSDRFLLGYGEIVSVSLNSNDLASWKGVRDVAGNHVAFVIVTAVYQGRFIPSDLAELRMTSAQLLAALGDANSEGWRRLHYLLERVFPAMNAEAARQALLQVEPEEIVRMNAADILALRFPDAFGKPSDGSFFEGREICWHSVRVTRAGAWDRWLVDVIGDWGLRRQLLKPQPVSPLGN